MNAPLVEPSACTWCGIARRGHARQYADAVGWHGWVRPTDAQILARMKARRLAVTVARVGALPMPVSPEPQAEERAKVAALIGDAKPATDQLLLEMAQQIRDRREHDHSTAADWDWYCLNASGWLGDKAPTVLRRLLDTEARVAELEAERHSTNESLSEAAEQLRANRDRITELEARLAEREQPADTYPPALPWAALMDADDLEGFLADLADAASGDDDLSTLTEVESTIARWRVIGEAQHAHNTTPGPGADDVVPQVTKLRAVLAEDPARCLKVHPFSPRDGWRIICANCDHIRYAPCHGDGDR